jgi:hypothetical protein
MLMGVSQLFAWLTATALLTITAIVIAARLTNPSLAIAAGAMFAGVAIFAGWRLNRPLADLPADRVTKEAAQVAARRNARLLATCYGWGGMAMLAAYYLSALHWQHAWQYGVGMLLIATAVYAYNAALADPSSPARQPHWLIAVQRLTMAQGFAAAVGVLILIVSGKLTAGKGDWIANLVFVAGGVAIAALSALSVRTQRRLMRLAAGR